MTVSILVIFYVLCGSISNVVSFRVFEDVDGTETILTFANENIIVQCKTDLPMTYCGFLHPKGKRYSGVNEGHCAIKINATKDDDGVWTCHIGMKNERLETIKKIRVRIANQLAAIQPNITAVHGKPVTIHCATTKGLMPISYCRFEPPKGGSFNIDSAVNQENPILNKYYYPQNRSLDRGDCAVTVLKVKYADGGVWTCGAGLDGKEYTDTIRIDVKGFYTMSTASATFVTCGGVLILVALVLFGIAWKKRKCLRGRRTSEPEEIYMHEIGEISSPRLLTVQSSSEQDLSTLMARL